MDKEINPLVALLVILLFLAPISLRFWAVGEMAATRTGVFFLEETPEGALSLQLDHLLVKQVAPGNDAHFLDLSWLGVQNPMSNLAYFSNGDFLVRSGAPDWGPRHYLSIASVPDPDAEAQREALVAGIEDDGLLIRCAANASNCAPFHAVTAAGRHRLYIDRDTDTVFVTEGIQHRLSAYDKRGQRLGLISRGLKFPKRLRKLNNQLYLIDTNHHRVAKIQSAPLALTAEAHELRPGEGSANIWMLDAMYFAHAWWVINARNGMSEAELQRYSVDGHLEAVVPLPEDVEPFDLLVWDRELLVSDLHQGRVLRINSNGELAGQFSSDVIDQYIAELTKRREQLQQTISLTNVALVTFIGGGVLLVVVVARRHRKLNPKPVKGALPAYLNPQVKLLQFPASTRTSFGGISVDSILVSNIEVVPGKRVVGHMGLVQGSTVRAKHAGKDIMAGLKNIFGGELAGYTELLSESRQEALDRMCAQAKAVGANAVINVRFSTSSITAGASEILAYGTAVFVEDK